MQQLVKEIVLLAQEQIEIRLIASFDEEDIAKLSDVIFKHLENTQKLEEIYGADRVNIRFTAFAGHFVLCFELYSQSCWIESELGGQNAALSQLYQVLTNKLTN